ncbi:Hypothetical predicted protein [Olea europaea subsp. europaea]|uniref:Uncharacterized protein n=1 Tax=Olea europaea subsp. europaea TaxID=158383 RepID=A0A8S0T748_OLEEU|nr:Hypothetical predicted protein [Olea europaea subsp. europaea]
MGFLCRGAQEVDPRAERDPAFALDNFPAQEDEGTSSAPNCCNDFEVESDMKSSLSRHELGGDVESVSNFYCFGKKSTEEMAIAKSKELMVERSRNTWSLLVLGMKNKKSRMCQENSLYAGAKQRQGS